jgi:glycosyltransferase involved in cell wall biosynthesis
VPLQRRSELIGKLLAAESSPFELASGDPVVVCTHGLPAGGAERQWIYLAQSLRDLGYRVSFVVYEPLGSQNSHYLPMLEALGIPLIDADSLSLAEQFELWPQSMSFDFMRLDIVPAAAHLLALTAAFRKLCPKVVFGQLDYGNLVAGFAALIAGVPRYVMSFRNYNPSHFPYLRNDWFLPAYRELTRFNRIMLAGNHKEGNHDYARWIGIAPERIAWIPNAIDAQTFPVPAQAEVDEVRAELQLQPDTPTILGVFRLSEEKDPLAFIEVCARVIDAVPGARAFIVGTGWMSAQIEQQIGAFGLSGRIRLLGQRTDVNALMRAASVLLLTSRHEGMPNVIMEAQMMGTPVVATGTGGVRDTVINGRSAVLLPVGDIDGLVRAVLDLLGDPTLAKRMGEAGCSHVLSAFPKRRLAEGYLSVARGEHLTAPAGERASLPSLAAAD